MNQEHFRQIRTACKQSLRPLRGYYEYRYDCHRQSLQFEFAARRTALYTREARALPRQCIDFGDWHAIRTAGACSRRTVTFPDTEIFAKNSDFPKKYRQFPPFNTSGTLKNTEKWGMNSELALIVLCGQLTIKYNYQTHKIIYSVQKDRFYPKNTSKISFWQLLR